MLGRSKSTISAWRLYNYGEKNPYLKLESIPFPKIKSPDEVLIKVHATSINPLDVMMAKGYGKNIIGTLRSFTESSSTTPFVLGRDFSGTVIARGGNLLDRYKIGDEVWGATFPSLTGCHAEYIVVHKEMVAKKPKGCTHVAAASLPYAGLTAWSALGITGFTQAGWNVLVIGAAGGVGTLAVQILKSWECQVTAVCSTDAVELVKNLGIDSVVDYKSTGFMEELHKLEKFDVILDCTDSRENHNAYKPLLKQRPHANYVTLSSPVLSSTDTQGLLAGLAKSATNLLCKNSTLGSYRWGYFAPNQKALSNLSRLVENGGIKPVVSETLKFSDILIGHSRVEEGHIRGKIVVTLE